MEQWLVFEFICFHDGFYYGPFKISADADAFIKEHRKVSSFSLVLVSSCIDLPDDVIAPKDAREHFEAFLARIKAQDLARLKAQYRATHPGTKLFPEL